MPQRITFFGAARTVTGSRHLIEHNGRTVLVDCGLYQGSRELRERNWAEFDFDPARLDAVILTHAHMDHIGLIPRLVREGYRGPFYATRATCALARISLPDSARIQEEDARNANKHGWSRHKPALPLYTEKEAYAALKQLEPLRYHEFTDLPGGGTWRFLPAGHILGSAFAEVYFANGERILMSGDLGRRDRPILKDPTQVDFAEYLVVESTYGDRDHPKEDPAVVLERLLNDQWQTGGALLVPSFAIGRTQELLYHIRQLQDAGRVPRIPVYVDSPMASATTLLTFQFDEELDHDARISLVDDPSPIRPHVFEMVRDRSQSKALNSHKGPLVIIAGSGMCNGGRIVHHLLNRLDDAKTTVLMTGFQAKGTPGRALLEGKPEWRMMGRTVNVAARIEKLNSLSAHADRSEIMAWLGGFKEPPRQTFVVHGEPEAQDALCDQVRRELGWNILAPEMGDSFDLGS